MAINRVSEFNLSNNQIKSAYIDMLNGFDMSGFEKLKPIFEEIAKNLSLADIERTSKFYIECHTSIDKAIQSANTSKEVETLLSFLTGISNIGEIGSMFYNLHANEISMKLEDLKTKEPMQETKEETVETANENQTKVSKLNRDQKSLESKYFGIKYRPNGNFYLKLSCSSLLTYFAIADIRRDEESYAKCDELIIEALQYCNKEEEYNGLLHFLEVASEVGEIGKMFYQKYENLITPETKEKFSEMVLV